MYLDRCMQLENIIQAGLIGEQKKIGWREDVEIMQ